MVIYTTEEASFLHEKRLYYKVQTLYQLLKSVYLEQRQLYRARTIEIVNVILQQKYKTGH